MAVESDDGRESRPGLADPPGEDAPHARPWQIDGIFDASDDAIICKTLDGRIICSNAAAERIFGYSQADLVGKPITLLIPPERLSEEVTILRQIAMGERVETYDTVRVGKDGRIVQVSVTISPIRDSSGAIVAACKIARDISERVATRARLQALQLRLLEVSRLSEMTQLALAFAREMEGPLGATRDYISGIKRQVSRGDWVAARLGCDLAAAQVDQADRVIQHLIGLLKDADPRRTTENLLELVEEACALAAVGAERAGVTVQYLFPAEPLIVSVDKIQIQHVVVNIVRNALAAMASSPRRELSVGAEPLGDGRVLVSIADTGCGLDEDVRDTLFQPPIAAKRGGAGIGLSVCRTIVEAHGGEIWAEARPGGGAMLRFSLDAA